MSWNLNQPITSELAAAKANKDGTDFTNPATWRLGLDVVSTNETRRQGTMDYAAVAFDGATASTRITSACQAIGTGDFSVWSRFRVPTSIPSGQFPGILSLTDSSTTTSRANALRLVMTDSGSLQVSRFGVTTSDVRTASIVGFRAAYSGQVVDIAVTRTGATLKVYINGTDTAYTDTASGTTPPAWSDTVVSDFVMIGATSATATTIFSGRIYRSVVFNRALSATDVTELITTGVNPADQWGTQTAVLNATFAGTTDSFIAAGAGVSVASVANQLEITSTTPTGGGALRTLTILRSKNYRITFKVRLQSGDSIGLVRGGGDALIPIGATTNLNFTPTSVLTQYLFEFNNPTDTSLYFRTNNTINPSVVELDDVVLERIGAIVDLDLSVGIGLFFPDRSDNRLGGDGFGGISHTMPKEYGSITVVKDLLHSDISATAATTSLFSLPPNCGVMFVELDRVTAFDAGITVQIGVSGTANKFLAATSVAATGITGANSASLISESNSANTSVFIQKSGATTTGRVRVRVTYQIRG